MGLLQINKMILIAGGVVLFVVIIVLGLNATRTSPPSGDVATSYTSSITGKDSVIFPDKGLEQGTVAPSVSIFGVEEFYNLYIDYQAASIQQQLQDFVIATSGYRATVAGIVDNQITRVNNNTLTFKLFINKPEATFDVTIVTENNAQQTPFISFK